VGAISISQLVLNEIAWSPGDPGTGAPSFFKIKHLEGSQATLAAAVGDSFLAFQRDFRPEGCSRVIVERISMPD
jgi:hypothetical protein